MKPDRMSDLPAPPPGTGVVFVNGSRHGEYVASWQSSEGEPPAAIGVSELTRDEAIAWARRQPAAKFLIAESGSDYVALT